MLGRDFKINIYVYNKYEFHFHNCHYKLNLQFVFVNVFEILLKNGCYSRNMKKAKNVWCNFCYDNFSSQKFHHKWVDQYGSDMIHQ